jgi:hypothetical protein
MTEKLGGSHVLQEFTLEILIVRERELGCSRVVREFEFGFLTVGNPIRSGRRKRISSSEALIFQWPSLGLCSEVKKVNFPRQSTTVSKLAVVGTFREDNQSQP